MRVLMVCMGNICRSPLAEGLLREHASRLKHTAGWQIDSAGTHDYHVGGAPDRRSVAVARQHGIDISAQRARHLSGADFSRFDWIIGMDRANLGAIESLRPASGVDTATGLILPLAGLVSPAEVPDPYYDGADAFLAVFRLLDSAMPGLIKRLSDAHNVP